MNYTNLLKVAASGALYGASIGMGLGLLKGLFGSTNGAPPTKEDRISSLPVSSTFIQQNGEVHHALLKLLSFRNEQTGRTFDKAVENVERSLHLQTIVSLKKTVPKASWSKTAHLYHRQYTDAVSALRKMISSPARLQDFDSNIEIVNKEMEDTLHNIMIHTSQRIADDAN
jgi:hypothetical protein